MSLPENFDLRKVLAKADSLEDLRKTTIALKGRYEPYLLGEKVWTQPELQNQDLPKLSHPPFFCQPYVRPPKKSHLLETEIIIEDLQEPVDFQESGKRRKLVIPEFLQAKLDPEVNYSLKKLKRMARKPLKNWDAERIVHIPCAKSTCTNPQGQKCEHKLCKPCCKSKCFLEELDCTGHKIWTKTVRLNARERDAAHASSLDKEPTNVDRTLSTVGDL